VSIEKKNKKQETEMLKKYVFCKSDSNVHEKHA